MSEVFHKDGGCVGDVPCRVAGAVHVEDVDRGFERGKRETQLFRDRDVDEGGVCTTVE